MQLRGWISGARWRASDTVLVLATVLAQGVITIPSAQTQTYSLLYSFQCGTYGANPYGGLVLDVSGNLYGTTDLGGARGDGTIFKLTPIGAETLLHSFAGSPTDAASPVSTLVRDPAGNLYGTTGTGGVNDVGAVFKLTPNGTETLLHSFNKTPRDGAYAYPGLFRDGVGNLYGTTTLGGAHGDGTVFKLTPSGTETLLHSFAGSPADGEHPHAGAVRDRAGNLYGTTLDGGAFGDGVVFELSPGGAETVLHSFGGSPGDGRHPHAFLVRDTAGNLYGTTLEGGAFNEGTVFELTPRGTETLLHSFDGSPNDGQTPHAGLVRDAAGNLYGTTLDGGAFGDGVVFELSPGGAETVLHSFAKSTTDGGTPESALVQDAAGNLYGTTYYGGASGCGTVFKYTP